MQQATLRTVAQLLEVVTAPFAVTQAPTVPVEQSVQLAQEILPVNVNAAKGEHRRPFFYVLLFAAFVLVLYPCLLVVLSKIPSAAVLAGSSNQLVNS